MNWSKVSLMVEEEMNQDALKIGFIFMIMGVLIFALGSPLRPEWFAQNNYILNAPVAILATFVTIGAVLMYLPTKKVRLKKLILKLSKNKRNSIGNKS